MLDKFLNGVQKPSNRALNIGKNTRAPMEGIFRGVRLFESTISRGCNEVNFD